jgi:hypothetical protein
MKKLLAAALLFGALVAFAQSFTCPVDDSSMVYMGQNKYVNGHEFKLFRCVQGHQYWFRTR